MSSLAAAPLFVAAQAPVTTQPSVPFDPPRLYIPGTAHSGAILCLDRSISPTTWQSFLEDVQTIARALGVSQFASCCSESAPYCPPNASPTNHRHQLMRACRTAQREQGRWPQFLLAVIPDTATWQIVQHFCVLENGIAVQCIYAPVLADSAPSSPTRLPAIARALSRLNVKLGGCNGYPVRLYEPLFHTLILGAAMEPLRGAAPFTYHCALVGTMDYAKHRWYTATSIQTATTHRIIHFDTMLMAVLDLLREPISRIVIVRAAIPPTHLENTVLYETDQVKAVMRARCGLEPRIVVAVPWDADHDASSAEDYSTTAVGVGSQPFAVPFNDFGGGWDTQAIGTYISGLAFDFVLDSRATMFPAPLKYASVAAALFNIHYIAARPKDPSRPYQGYKTMCRQMAMSPYWL
ncbi:hypothetical protein AURDEDRAFT_157516 [Auricularia subglabra TFB-10046 SS5]|nr:hypothetical protein AURDEDRAFT_157516 [Auricularia subglabra TFB-10046 SS5]